MKVMDRKVSFRHFMPRTDVNYIRNYMKELRYFYHVDIIQIRGVRKIKLHLSRCSTIRSIVTDRHNKLLYEFTPTAM